jgi:hypothetical protein
MNRALSILGLVACALGAVLAATITVLLTPLYWGAQLVPLAVVLALVANVVFPLLVRELGLSPLAAALPFGLWLITVLVLASSRPEGDILLPGGKGGQQLVTYGMLLAGALAGGVTLARMTMANVVEREDSADDGTQPRLTRPRTR